MKGWCVSLELGGECASCPEATLGRQPTPEVASGESHPVQTWSPLQGGLGLGTSHDYGAQCSRGKG